ncbi:uncharacterized protein N0V89_002727 [Didymosphaeria variabile]|uniref:Uncharacterized protein n=1 Tax=Didymosphaeria variabile TaxID=1932322 RepID=A0A9W9CEW3_9PLEO|nr:uncharacterized protein N0V89_002727 [Didymosphaeria variabile]KAJ4358148.1 hypothetical protein N0V89_002727 [Didymosphaeria variabile]
MLPQAVFAQVLLATTALAIPQASLIIQNLTPTDSTTHSDPTTAPARAHPESTVDGWGDGITETATGTCDSPDTCPPFLVHVETTVTGFEDLATTTALESFIRVQTSQHGRADVVTTSTPSLVNIHTEVVPTTQQRLGRPSETPVGIPTRPEDSPTPGVPQATPSPDSLLLDIVSRIAISASSTGSGSNPPNNRLPATSETGLSNNDDPTPQTHANAQSQQATEAGSSASIAPVGSAPEITAGGQITLGSAILTLTPGLSSTLGDGATATYVEITTNDAGQTLITVSSNGTAVIATVTEAPAAVTKPKTGFEASITTAARPATLDSTGDDNTVPTTSSRGSAVPQKAADMGQWLYVGLGLVGLRLVAG